VIIDGSPGSLSRKRRSKPKFEVGRRCERGMWAAPRIQLLLDEGHVKATLKVQMRGNYCR
jgi:hypothetical protein